MNDGNPNPPITVQYVSVYAIIEGIMAQGRGTVMASMYRNVSIHPNDRPLLGMQWHGKYFVYMVLPFGLCSALFIFTCIADLVEWILVHNYGVDFLRHYLDDFFTLGSSSSQLCHSYLLTCVCLCERLGLPLHPDNLEGPVTCPLRKERRLLRCLKSGPPSVSVRGRSWNLWLVTSITPARLPHEGGHFLLDDWLALCLLPGESPHQAKPRILSGPYLLAGGFSNLGWPQFLLHAHVGCLSGISTSPRMLQAHWAMGLFLTPSGFAAPGLWSKGHCRSCTRSSSPSFDAPPYGVLSGSLSGSSSCVSISQWWLYLSLALHGSNTWWGCCIIYPCWLYAIHLCLLCLQFAAWPIQ